MNIIIFNFLSLFFNTSFLEVFKVDPTDVYGQGAGVGQHFSTLRTRIRLVRRRVQLLMPRQRFFILECISTALTFKVAYTHHVYVPNVSLQGLFVGQRVGTNVAGELEAFVKGFNVVL